VRRPQPARSTRWRRALAAIYAPFACRSDVLLVPDPELFLTARLQHSRGARAPLIVVDVHEDFELVAADRAWIPSRLVPLMALLARAAVRSAARADLLLVADDHLPPRSGAGMRLVVRNRPTVGELEAGSPGPEPRAVYVGDIRASRGLHEMVGAILDAPGWSLDLVGPISAPDQREVLRRARRAGRTVDIRVHGRLPLTEAWDVARGAWAGFALLKDTPAFRAAVPTKLYEYTAVGIPVICSDLPPCRRFIESSGSGAVVQGGEQAGAILRDWLTSPSLVTSFSEAGRAWAAHELAEPSDFDRFAYVLRQLVANRRPST
jgi:glycosyltransferase involved in cell wall biosynthesis